LSSATLSLPSALGGLDDQGHAGKETRYPVYMWLDGPQIRSGRVRKISPPPGFYPRTDQPVASRFNN